MATPAKVEKRAQQQAALVRELERRMNGKSPLPIDDTATHGLGSLVDIDRTAIASKPPRQNIVSQ